MGVGLILSLAGARMGHAAATGTLDPRDLLVDQTMGPSWGGPGAAGLGGAPTSGAAVVTPGEAGTLPPTGAAYLPDVGGAPAGDGGLVLDPSLDTGSAASDGGGGATTLADGAVVAVVSEDPAHGTFHEMLLALLDTLLGTHAGERAALEGEAAAEHGGFHDTHEGLLEALEGEQADAAMAFHAAQDAAVATHDAFHDDLDPRHDAYHADLAQRGLARDAVLADIEQDVHLRNALQDEAEHTLFHTILDLGPNDATKADLHTRVHNASSVSPTGGAASQAAYARLTSNIALHHGTAHSDDPMVEAPLHSALTDLDEDAQARNRLQDEGEHAVFHEILDVGPIDATRTDLHTRVHNTSNVSATGSAASQAAHTRLHGNTAVYDAQQDAADADEHAAEDDAFDGEHTDFHDGEGTTHEDFSPEALTAMHEAFHDEQDVEADAFTAEQEGLHQALHEDLSEAAATLQAEQQGGLDTLLATHDTFHMESGAPDTLPLPEVDPVPAAATPVEEPLEVAVPPAD